MVYVCVGGMLGSPELSLIPCMPVTIIVTSRVASLNCSRMDKWFPILLKMFQVSWMIEELIYKQYYLWVIVRRRIWCYTSILRNRPESVLNKSIRRSVRLFYTFNSTQMRKLTIMQRMCWQINFNRILSKRIKFCQYTKYRFLIFTISNTTRFTKEKIRSRLNVRSTFPEFAESKASLGISIHFHRWWIHET